MTFYAFATIHMMLFGVATITLIASRPPLQRWGFALGFYNQWAWYYIAYHDQSWGIMAMNVVYTLNYLRGLRFYWRNTWK